MLTNENRTSALKNVGMCLGIQLSLGGGLNAGKRLPEREI